MEALIITGVGIVAVTLIVILLVFVPWRHVDAVASAFSWCRSVDIDRQLWISRTSMAPPSGIVQNVKLRTLRYAETKTEWKQRGRIVNGQQTFVTEPVQKTEWKTRTVYTYEALEWHKSRSVTASGASRADVRLPAYELATNERIGGQSES